MKPVMVAMGRRTISELSPVKRRYRSGFEEKLAQQIEDAELEVQYETITLGYTWPARDSRYTPDFALDKPDGTQMLLEGKGLFDTEARAKMLLVKDNILTSTFVCFLKCQRSHPQEVANDLRDVGDQARLSLQP